MTTNKPEVVAEVHQHLNNLVVDWKSRASESVCVAGDQLIRLSDYEALQAECEKLRAAMIEAKSYIEHYMYGGSSYREPAAKAVALIDAALAAYRKQEPGHD